MTVEHDYLVVVETYTTYRVRAETPEAAAADLLEWDGAQDTETENVSVSVDRVVAADGSWTDDDLRADVTCPGGCGRAMPARASGMCLDCFLRKSRS